MNRPYAVATLQVAEVDSLFQQPLDGELREVVMTERPGVGAPNAHAGGGHQRGRRQAAALPLAPLNLLLAVRFRITSHVQQIVDGDAAQAEDVERFRHGCTLVDQASSISAVSGESGAIPQTSSSTADKPR